MSLESFNSAQNPESFLVQKYNLVHGKNAVFEKVSIETSSEVPVGTQMGGSLERDVVIGESVTFQGSDDVISRVTDVWEKEGALFLRTKTSTYKLVSEQVPSAPEGFKFENIERVVTERGSVYSYLPDGTTQRFKTAENYLSSPKDILVYLPEDEHYDEILDYVHNPEKDIDIVNRAGKILLTNQDVINDGGEIFLACGQKGKVELKVPVSHLPKLGYATFDRKNGANGKWSRRHLGHKVTEIILKK